MKLVAFENGVNHDKKYCSHTDAFITLKCHRY